jgi:hypothetical protein
MVLFKTIRSYPENKYPEVLGKMVSQLEDTLIHEEDETNCILCNQPTMNMALLVPDKRDDALGKVPEGKTRLVIFTICPTC